MAHNPRDGDGPNPGNANQTGFDFLEIDENFMSDEPLDYDATTLWPEIPDPQGQDQSADDWPDILPEFDWPDPETERRQAEDAAARRSAEEQAAKRRAEIKAGKRPVTEPETVEGSERPPIIIPDSPESRKRFVKTTLETALEIISLDEPDIFEGLENREFWEVTQRELFKHRHESPDEGGSKIQYHLPPPSYQQAIVAAEIESSHAVQETPELVLVNEGRRQLTREDARARAILSRGRSVRAKISRMSERNVLEEMKWDFMTCMFHEARNRHRRDLLETDLNFLQRLYERSVRGDPSHVRQACDPNRDPRECCWSHYFSSVLAITEDGSRQWQAFINFFARDLVRQILIHIDRDTTFQQRVKRYPKHVVTIFENWMRDHVENMVPKREDLTNLSLATGVDERRIAAYMEEQRHGKSTRKAVERVAQPRVAQGEDVTDARGINEVPMLVQQELIRLAYKRRSSSMRITATEAEETARKLGEAFSAQQVKDWMDNFRLRNRELVQRKRDATREEITSVINETMQGLPTPAELEEYRRVLAEEAAELEGVIMEDAWDVQEDNDEFPLEAMDTGEEAFAGTNIASEVAAQAIELNADDEAWRLNRPQEETDASAEEAGATEGGTEAGTQETRSPEVEKQGSPMDIDEVDLMESETGGRGQLPLKTYVRRRRQQEPRKRTPSPEPNDSGVSQPDSSPREDSSFGEKNASESSMDTGPGGIRSPDIREGWFQRLGNDIRNDARAGIARQRDPDPDAPDWPDPEEMKRRADQDNDQLNTIRWSFVYNMVGDHRLRIDPITARAVTDNCQFVIDLYTNLTINTPQHCKRDCDVAKDPMRCCWRKKFKKVEETKNNSAKEDLIIRLFQADLVRTIYDALREDTNWGRRVRNRPDHIQVKRYPNFCHRILRQWVAESSVHPRRTEKAQLSLDTGMPIEAIERWFKYKRFQSDVQRPEGTRGARRARVDINEEQRRILSEFFREHGPYPERALITEISQRLEFPRTTVQTFGKRFRAANQGLWDRLREEAAQSGGSDTESPREGAAGGKGRGRGRGGRRGRGRGRRGRGQN